MEKSIEQRRWFIIAVMLFIALLLFIHEPALANKFETIGGGIGGSRKLKLDWLQGFLYVVGGISLLSGVLAVVFPHKNTLFLNATNWKMSAAILFVLSALCFIGGYLL